jgi:ligand-binding sensor domain-containing protein/signal transduction histidine kinase
MKSISNTKAILLGLRCIVIFMVCVLFTTRLHAQRFPFHNLSVDEGLMQSQATCLAQDKTGYLWIGTLGGLSRYDGRNFTNYSIKNGLLNNSVWAVAADTEGNIWIGSHNGISRFDGKHFVHYAKEDQAMRTLNSTQQIQIVNDTAWWRTSGDVYFINRGKIKYFVAPGAAGVVSAILAETGSLWMAKDGVIYHQENDHVDTVRFSLPPEQKAPEVHCIFRDKDAMLWLGTNNGLYKLVQNRLSPHRAGSDTSSVAPDVRSITQDRAGALWLGTNHGVIKVTGSTFQSNNKHNGLTDNTIFDVLTDAEGNVWMASDGQGIFRYSGTQFTGLDESMGLPSAQVMAISGNGKDSLFLGTYDAGLYVFKDGKVSSMSLPSNPAPAVTSLCYAKDGKLWIGTKGKGLWSYEKNIFRQYASPERSFPSNFINRIYQDPDNRLWIGFANGVIVYDHDSFKTVDVKNLPVISFYSIGADSILMATERGLMLYSGGNVSEFKTNSVLDSYSVQCFVLKGRDLWIGSSDNGVIRYSLETGKTLVINKSSGLRSDFIYNIITDNEGNIWVGTGFGIDKITMDQQDEPQISFYGKAQGITGMESNINAVFKLPDGGIWFGTTNGALHYQPNTTVVLSVPSSIVLQSVKLTGENAIDSTYYDSTDNWYGIPYNLRLPYKKNNISFTFQAITLSGAQQALYRYHMDGLDAPWSDWSATNSVSYSALPPGKYVFHVECQGAGDKTAPELTYSFEIITPFQKTMWFRYAVLAACILLGIGLQLLVNTAKQRRQRLLVKMRAEEQSKIRLRTAEDFHDEIGNKLTRINVLANILKSKVFLTPETTKILGQIEENTNQLYGGTRDILWSLKPSNDNLYEILHHIRDFGTELFQDTGITFEYRGTLERYKNYRLPLDMSRNLIMIFKEALNNALKHSNAKKVTLESSMKVKGVLQMVLKDNGDGFDMLTVKKGNGLINMQTRAERLKGKLYIDSTRGKGTILNLNFKIPPNK